MTKLVIKDFQCLNTLADFANILAFPPKKLSFILYKLNGGPSGQYCEFEIKKRSGNTRKISAPYTGLKMVQKLLAEKLQDIYVVKKPVHGFVREKNILTNAHRHSRKRYVFNIDLKDFFPSIHFGRVMGLFMAKPYEFKRNIAILIAKIVCLNDTLPQGSPCSPVISNMICAHLDKQIGELAKKNSCYYTRYADDLTFSTNKVLFPEEIAIQSDNKWDPSSKLCELIKHHSFEININKTSMRTQGDRQIVTGIVVNQYPNIHQKSLKQVRAMLHDWNVNGIEKAQRRYQLRFDLANREKPKDATINFCNVVRGKIEYIRQIKTYRINLLNEIEKKECVRKRILYTKKDLQTIHKDQHYKYFQRFEQLIFRDCGIPIILGEGETDWMHLRMALAHFKKNKDCTYPDLYIHKHKPYALGGFNYLNNFCDNAERLYVRFLQPVICIYDCDIPAINNKHQTEENKFLSHGNNVYSIVLQQPKHRKTNLFSIEQLYTNTDLLKKDAQGRRIFLSTEFDHMTGKYKQDELITYGRKAKNNEEIKNWKKTLSGDEKIIDNAVCIEKEGKLNNIALSKKDFALHIIKKDKPFDKIDFSEFKNTFNLIEFICNIVK